MRRSGFSSPIATAYFTNTDFKPGTYVLFAVLCGAASYIAVPAVQRLAIPEASPTLPLAASLGLTFSYNVTIGIPLYIEINRRNRALVHLIDQTRPHTRLAKQRTHHRVGKQPTARGEDQLVAVGGQQPVRR